MDGEIEMKRLKSIKMISVILIFIVLTIFDWINSTNIMDQYPQLIIQGDELLGDNLKDFHLQEDGSLVSESEDPWSYYILPNIMKVKEIEVIVDSVYPENAWSQFHFILESTDWIYQYYHIHTGVNKIKINGNEGLENVSDIRFDLLCEKNATIKVNKIIINNKGSLTFKYHIPLLLAIFVLLILILLKKRKTEYKKSDIKEIYTGLWTSFAVSFLLFFFAPFDLYFNNKEEFWFDIYRLFPIVICMFIVGMLGLSIIIGVLFLIHKKIYRLGVISSFIILICSYIQGNYLTKSLPPLDGTDFKWADYLSGYTESVILWCVITVIIIICILCIKKIYIMIKCFSVFVVLMLLITLGIECFTTYGYQKKLDASITTENQFEMSQEQNFVILVLDALEADTFNVVLDNHPEYKETFSDFTYYPNTMGAYPYTSRSIPFILSGKWFENKELFEKYNEDVYKNSSFFEELEKNGYKMGIYEPDMPITDKSIYRFDNVIAYNTKINSYLDFMLYELKLIGFKYAPFQMKKNCLINTDYFRDLREDEVHTTWFNGYNTQFYEDIHKEDITYAEQKCFRFIHIEGAHVPFQYDKDVNVIENGTYEQNIEASITITDAYLKKLKDAGVYDNSVIIVMADHGYNWVEGSPCARQNPILMVKGINEKHEMHISNAPISYEDLQAAYMRLMDGKSSDKIFDWQEGDRRERRFLMYTFLEEDFMTEYMQTGEASDVTSIYPTGRKFNR